MGRSLKRSLDVYLRTVIAPRKYLLAVVAAGIASGGVAAAVASTVDKSSARTHPSAAKRPTAPTVVPQKPKKLRTAVSSDPSLLPAVRPPRPRITTLGATREATLFSYCWQQARPGGGGTGVCADGAPGSPAQFLRWRPGTAVTVDLRLPAHDVLIDAARIGGFGRPMRDVVHLRARGVDRAGRRWLIRLPKRATRDTDLVISARFASGDLGADLGLNSH
jgi:hypothetical protein